LKFKDVNQELSFKINNLMVSQFFNTAIIILILEVKFSLTRPLSRATEL
jgi:hypothetical protein